MKSSYSLRKRVTKVWWIILITTTESDQRMTTSTRKQIVIIGSGVIGLTTAYVLTSKYSDADIAIIIIARDTPENGMDSAGWASPWAGANWFPFVDKDPENSWERTSFQRFKSEEIPKGIVMDLPTKYYAPDAERLKKLWYRDVVSAFQVVSEPFPTSITGTPAVPSGFEFTTISINVPLYLKWLYDTLLERGVRFVHGWVSSVEDVEYVPGSKETLRTDIVINASGLGAKTITGIADPLVFPIRGQTVLVRAPDVRWCLTGMGLYINNETGEAIYIIPRSNGDVIVGGTFQEDNWDVSPDPSTARSILSRALQYCPELSSSDPPELSTVKILRHNVGCDLLGEGGRVEKETVSLPLRTDSASVVLPSQGKEVSWRGIEPIGNGMRGAESVFALGGDVPVDQGPRSIRVVHAYGIGPAGYQASWGIAEEVATLVEEFFQVQI